MFKFPLMFKKTHNTIVEMLHDEIAKLRSEKNKLLLDLVKAKKNDTPKDPKTGKFAKR